MSKGNKKRDVYTLQVYGESVWNTDSTLNSRLNIYGEEDTQGGGTAKGHDAQHEQVYRSCTPSI